MKVRELIGELWKLNSETDIGFALTLPQSPYDIKHNNPITDFLGINLEDWIHITNEEKDNLALVRFRVEENELIKLSEFQQEGRMCVEFRKED
jgi:hypothetical protein